MKSFREFLTDLVEMSSDKYKTVADRLATSKIPNAAVAAGLHAATQLKGSGNTVKGLNPDNTPIYAKQSNDADHLDKHLKTKIANYTLARKKEAEAKERERMAK